MQTSPPDTMKKPARAVGYRIAGNSHTPTSFEGRADLLFRQTRYAVLLGHRDILQRDWQARFEKRTKGIESD